MTNSMTGFSRVQCKEPFGSLTWELRSVNHRYLDINFRLPDDLRAAEGRYRELLGARLSRGKLECNLRLKSEVNINSGIEINESLTKSLMQTCAKVHSMLHQSSDINVIDVLKWPGVVIEPEMDMKPVIQASEKLLEQALDELILNRAREGERLNQMIASRCEAIDKIINQVRLQMPEIQSKQRQKILERFEELNLDPDMERVEQELVILVQKMDVAEELDRLEAHLKELKDVLGRNEAVGRRMDFLMQELNREANTLGSKSADISMTQASVELKVLIEQMREQIQNIE